MTRDPYFTAPGLNWTRLKAMRDSPLAFDYAEHHEREDVLHFRLGRAVHSLALEEKEDFIVYGGTRRGEPWKRFQQLHADCETILTQGEYDNVLDMRDALVKHPHFAAFDGHREHILFWTDAATGIPCKCRIDDCGGGVTELKSTAADNMKLFVNDCAKYGYANQLCWYEWGAAENGIRQTRPPGIVAVQSGPIHDVWRFVFGEQSTGILEKARFENRALLDRYADCVASGEWPGACPEPLDIASLWPRWDMPREEGAGATLDFGGIE